MKSSVRRAGTDIVREGREGGKCERGGQEGMLWIILSQKETLVLWRKGEQTTKEMERIFDIAYMKVFKYLL